MYRYFVTVYDSDQWFPVLTCRLCVSGWYCGGGGCWRGPRGCGRLGLGGCLLGFLHFLCLC